MVYQSTGWKSDYAIQEWIDRSTGITFEMSAVNVSTVNANFSRLSSLIVRRIELAKTGIDVLAYERKDRSNIEPRISD